MVNSFISAGEKFANNNNRFELTAFSCFQHDFTSFVRNATVIRVAIQYGSCKPKTHLRKSFLDDYNLFDLSII